MPSGLLGNGNGTFQSTAQSLPNSLTSALTYVRDLDLDSRDDYLGASCDTDGRIQKLCASKAPRSLRRKSGACIRLKPASPVLIRASGNSPAGVIQLQVWIEGVKKAVRWQDQMANKFSLSSGTHRIAVVAVDKFSGTATTAVNVTVP